MFTYRYRIYLKDRTFDVVIETRTPSEGTAMLEAQYSGARVTWMGNP